MSDHDRTVAWSGLCPSGQHGLDYRGQICDLCPTPFAIWPKDGSDADARIFHALSPHGAAEQCAREDWLAGATIWPIAYCARNGITGKLWVVDVTLASQPSFIATDAREVPMAAVTHVMWGCHVLCEDLRLRRVPRDWPVGQRWISLKDVANGIKAPPDPCVVCWDKVPEAVDGLRQIGKMGT